jgi:hypothetical protein
MFRPSLIRLITVKMSGRPTQYNNSKEDDDYDDDDDDDDESNNKTLQ